MAGGTWTSQNKVRPGAYINFKAVPKPSMTVGDRGVMAIPLSLNWGATGQLIEVLSSDLLDGNSKKLVGFTAFDSDSKILASALSYCYKALVYRTDAGGAKATATIGNITATAKYFGKLGNNIVITISENTTTELWTVITYLDGVLVDKQVIAQASELENNDYVDFTIDENEEMVETAGTSLTGGTNGTVTESTAYPAFLNLLAMARWQTMACLSSDSDIKASIQTFIRQCREDEGRYVQGVVGDYDGADYEGIINSISGAVIDGVSFSKYDFVAIVAGMTAGANFNESNTARKITGATSIIGELTDSQIKTALGNGKFLLSASADGSIKVEQDINSLHTYTQDRNYNFSKNRVIRTLDEIGTTTKITWENTYMGKVDNNDVGRGLFKADLVQYGNQLQQLSGIQEFTGADDITISQGNDLDSVLVDWYIKPVDSMEKLYMTVNVNS
jgi:hypothetical protein